MTALLVYQDMLMTLAQVLAGNVLLDVRDAVLLILLHALDAWVECGCQGRHASFVMLCVRLAVFLQLTALDAQLVNSSSLVSAIFVQITVSNVQTHRLAQHVGRDSW